MQIGFQWFTLFKVYFGFKTDRYTLYICLSAELNSAMLLLLKAENQGKISQHEGLKIQLLARFHLIQVPSGSLISCSNHTY